MGGRGNNQFLKQSLHPYCQFRNFCIFLNGEAPETILAERDYLRGKVNGLEFAIDFSNHQVKKLLERIKELEDDNNQLETDPVQDVIVLHKQYSDLTTEEWRAAKQEILKRFRKISFGNMVEQEKKNVALKL